MKNLIYFTLIALIPAMVLSSCSKQAEKIAYGTDQCSFCKMNIVDKAHAAQYVSSKGKQFKYDAVECLIRDLVRNDIRETARILVADYDRPGTMIDAHSATFIISPNIKSPMGANLSAVADAATGKLLQSEFGGELYPWESIKIQITGKK